MKKLLPILILIIIGSLSPLININAQYAGKCWSRGLVIQSTLIRPIANQADCMKAAAPNNGTWWQSAGAPPAPDGPPIPSIPVVPLGPTLPGTLVPVPTAPVDTNYYLLAPLPCSTPGTNGCTDKGLEAFNPTGKGGGALGGYLNLMIKLFIGICAVLAVIMIVIGGIQYMTTELISSKEEGKKRIMGAIFGLLLALGAYTLLNTINPDLLNSDLSTLEKVTVEVTIANFQIASSGPQSRYGTAITVDFNSQAYPAAAAAQIATGVDPALVLSIFNQETASGASTGACFPANANMNPADKTALASIVGVGNVDTTHVSCSLAQGHGGAVGLTQFLPTTWIDVRDKQGATAILGHNPDPWNTNDALMMTALYLKQLGGAGSDPAAQKNAVCHYFGACTSSGVNYGDQVMAQATSIQKQIAQAKANGKIKS